MRGTGKRFGGDWRPRRETCRRRPKTEGRRPKEGRGPNSEPAEAEPKERTAEYAKHTESETRTPSSSEHSCIRRSKKKGIVDDLGNAAHLVRSPHSPGDRLSRCLSDFGFRPSFGLRPSAFGFSRLHIAFANQGEIPYVCPVVFELG